MLNKQEEKKLLAAIRKADKLTSGEIRVHIQKSCGENPIEDAIEKFDAMGLWKTRERNGVLFFVATEDHQFAIIGDKGIQEKAGDKLWDEIKVKMQAKFRQGELANGLIQGVELAGKALSDFFPRQKDDINELPDDISMQKD